MRIEQREVDFALLRTRIGAFVLSVSCGIEKLRDQNTGGRCLICGMDCTVAQCARDAMRTELSEIVKRFL
jgi:hypothetical protein